MTDAGRHPNITLLTMSEVKGITGFVGNFHVRILKRARYVREKECTACGDCVEVCPVIIPDEFNMGLSSRRAIYSPFPQAVPSAYAVDITRCLGHNPIICGKCIEKCKKRCIDFDMNDEEMEFDVGTIIVATGMEAYDPTILDEYGYTRYENVLTSMELERLINAGGPTGGKVIRLTDGTAPKSVAFIQCVGSRSQRRGRPYCSNICCMNTVKSTIMLKEHYPDMEVKVFYIDIRAFGKGFEDLFRRSKGMGVRYIRGLPGDIKEDIRTRDLILTVENTATNELESHRTEMVVLAVGLEPTGGHEGYPGDAGPSDNIGRLLHGSPPEASARRCGDTGDILCRLRRRSQGHKGFRHPGLCSHCPGHAPHESRFAHCGGDHSGSRSRSMQLLRPVCKGVPVQCHQRGHKGKDGGGSHRSGLFGVRHMRCRMPHHGHYDESFYGRADRGPD